MSTPISSAASNDSSVLAGASALAPPCPIRWQKLAVTVQDDCSFHGDTGHHRSAVATSTDPGPITVVEKERYA